MTKNEQIDEMAFIIQENSPLSKMSSDDLAESLYNANFRKVERGEWKTNHEKFCNIYDHFYCSNCGNYTEERNPYKLGKYCSYCGADMRGGLDNEQRTDN